MSNGNSGRGQLGGVSVGVGAVVSVGVGEGVSVDVGEGVVVRALVAVEVGAEEAIGEGIGVRLTVACTTMTTGVGSAVAVQPDKPRQATKASPKSTFPK